MMQFLELRLKLKSLKAVILTGGVRYEKELHWGHFATPIWVLCTETMRQLESEQYILAKGFVKIENRRAI
jgi:hypothetical protein